MSFHFNFPFLFYFLNIFDFFVTPLSTFCYFRENARNFWIFFLEGTEKNILRYGKRYLYDIFFVLMWPCFTIGPSLCPPLVQNYIDIQHTKQNLVPGCISYSNTNINVSPSSLPTKSQKFIYQGT
jgi:hypothetical protein